MPRIRTIRKAYEEIKRTDPDTCISEYYIRQLVMSGFVKSRLAGTRYLLDLDDLERYLEGENSNGF